MTVRNFKFESLLELPTEILGIYVSFTLPAKCQLRSFCFNSLQFCLGAYLVLYLLRWSEYKIIYCCHTGKACRISVLIVCLSNTIQAVMKSTRRRLEEELMHEDITKLEDLPSYNLLIRWCCSVWQPSTKKLLSKQIPPVDIWYAVLVPLSLW